MTARAILATYATPTLAEVVASFPRPSHGPVRIVRYRGRPWGGEFDVWLGSQRVYWGANTEGHARWLASNFAPAARPA